MFEGKVKEMSRKLQNKVKELNTLKKLFEETTQKNDTLFSSLQQLKYQLHVCSNQVSSLKEEVGKLELERQHFSNLHLLSQNDKQLLSAQMEVLLLSVEKHYGQNELLSLRNQNFALQNKIGELTCALEKTSSKLSQSKLIIHNLRPFVEKSKEDSLKAFKLQKALSSLSSKLRDISNLVRLLSPTISLINESTDSSLSSPLFSQLVQLSSSHFLELAIEESSKSDKSGTAMTSDKSGTTVTSDKSGTTVTTDETGSPNNPPNNPSSSALSKDSSEN